MGTINTLLNSVSASLAQQTAPAPVKSTTPAQATQAAQSTPADSFSAPSNSIIQSASLLSASSGFAQLGSLLEVAQGGTQQVNSVLQQLVALAQQVPQTNDLSGIDSEFSQLIAQINQTANGTTFGGSSLLSGNYAPPSGSAAATASVQQEFSLPDLTTQGLFGSSTPNISTPANAQSALVSLATAQQTVSASSGNISDVLAQLSFATASVNTALANRDAASSTLSDGDIAEGSTTDSFSALLGSPSSAAQVQSANLSPSLLSLLQE